MITHAVVLSQLLDKIWSPAVVYKAEDEEHFIGGVMGVTNVGQNKMEISDPKPTYKPSFNKTRIFSIEEVDFCTAFVGGVPGKKICGLMKGDNGYYNKYKTHTDLEKGHMESAFYLTTNGTNLFLKPLVSLIIGDTNQVLLSQVGEDLYKDTAMDIMEEVKRITNNSTEVVEEDYYVRKIPESGTEVIDELTGADPGSPAKRMKTFVPPYIETISDTVI